MQKLAALHLIPVRWSGALSNYHAHAAEKPTSRALKLRLIVIVVVCLVIVGSRVVRLSSLEMDRDEVWSVWQTFGTPSQIINWTPYDWPPLYYLLLGGWRVVTGISPFALRVFSLFLFLPGVALLYRIGSKQFNDTTALIAAVACAAMGYLIHVSISVRAYSLIFTLVMLAWWLALTYFAKPSIGRGIALGLCILALFYTHFTTIFPVALLIAYIFIFYPHRVWRWWLPLSIAGIGFIPEILAKSALTSGRASSGMPILKDWLASGAHIYLQNLERVLQNFAGYNFELWIVFVFIAGVMILSQFRLQRNVLGLILWMLAPVIFFFAVLVDAFDERTFAWALGGYALWIGWGMSRLPKAAIAAILVVLLVVMNGSVPITENYKGIDTPLVEGYNFLNQHLQPGDAVLVDPNMTVAAEEWDYFTRAYFPQGLLWVHDPSDYRRIWYFSTDGKQNSKISGGIQQNRLSDVAFHYADFSLQLYEAPPDLKGVPFANGMRFDGVEVLDQPGPTPIYRTGDTVRMRLWWSIDAGVPLDYSVGEYVTDKTGVLAHVDGPPQPANDPHETSRWITGHYYVEERDITLPPKMASGSYPVLMSVYQWWDEKRIAAPGTNSDDLLPILTLQIKSWQ